MEFTALKLAYSGISGYRLPDGADIHAEVSGRWDWSTRSRPCTDSAHVIAFSDDGEVMTIVQERSASDSLAADEPAIYDLESATQSRIRGAIRGEGRLTAAGTPVVWELVMFGPDEYRWHRVDWDATGFTPAVNRCSATSGRGGTRQ